MRRSATLAISAVAAALVSQTAAAAGTVRLIGEGADYSVRVATLKEVRDRRAFRATVRQQHDFSCGSAAVATLLTHQYGRSVTEADVFRVMYAQGDQEKIRRHGFSLLDMKRYLEAMGFSADGFEVPLDKLAETRVPAIALVRENGYNHFVVIRGLRAGKVLIGDPSSGGRILPRDDFERMWQEKILFVIRSHAHLARFDVPDHWLVRLPAPLAAEGLNRAGLADPTLMMRGPNDF